MGITIDEAIKVLADKTPITTRRQRVEYNKATKLGIEALKQIKSFRDTGIAGYIPPLPGETQDIVRGMTETMFINPETD